MRVEIERLAYGGSGIARKDGKVYFVKGGLPNDIVDIKVTNDKGKFAEAVIESIVEPSRERVEPPCRVFHICGGCQLQNLSYPAQLREKEGILRETLQRIGGFRRRPDGAHIPIPVGVRIQEARSALGMVSFGGLARGLLQGDEQDECKNRFLSGCRRGDK